jgi:hypothetical protein
VQFLLAAESTKFISVISFGKELYKRIERSESSSFRFKRQLPSSVSLSQRSLANRKVFRIGSHATSSKSSPRKVLFSSVQELQWPIRVIHAQKVKSPHNNKTRQQMHDSRHNSTIHTTKKPLIDHGLNTD